MADEESDEGWRFSVDEFDDSPETDASAGPDSSMESESHGDADGWDEIDSSSGPGSERDDTSDDTEREDARGDGENAEGEDASVAGEFSPKVPVEPELPELENAAFVTLGVILTILTFASVIGGPAFGILDTLTICLIVGAIGALTYGVFLRLTPDT